MKKILACVMCIILMFCTAIPSSAAVQTADIPSSDSFRNQIINAVLNSASWQNSNGVTSVFMFVDLNFDGNLEFLVERYGNGVNRMCDVYTLGSSGNLQTVTVNSQGLAIQSSGLTGYYDKTNKKYRMLGSSTSGGMFYNTTTYYELIYNKSNRSYSLNKLSQTIPGLTNVNMKFDTSNKYSNYKSSSCSAKKSILQKLYDSFTYTKQSTSNPTVYKTGTKYGDLDGDDKITSSDSLYVLRASVNLESVNATQKKLSDVDKDGNVTSNDALEILRYSVGLGNNKYINKKA